MFTVTCSGIYSQCYEDKDINDNEYKDITNIVVELEDVNDIADELESIEEDADDNSEDVIKLPPPVISNIRSPVRIRRIVSRSKSLILNPTITNMKHRQKSSLDSIGRKIEVTSRKNN